MDLNDRLAARRAEIERERAQAEAASRAAADERRAEARAAADQEWAERVAAWQGGPDASAERADAERLIRRGVRRGWTGRDVAVVAALVGAGLMSLAVSPVLAAALMLGAAWRYDATNKRLRRELRERHPGLFDERGAGR